MTQTARDKTPTPRPKSASSSQKLTRPGQRQQERLERLARRRRRTRTILTVVALIFLVAAAGVGAWQYQKYSADVQASKDKGATATAIATITPTPSAGPATPPPYGGQIVAGAEGLQYLDVKTGTGNTAANGDKVTLQYTLWLKKDGKKMDSSYDRGGDPLVFTLGEEGIIKGFSMGIEGMKEGGTRRLYIPASLGYKDQATGDIPANSDLIFDVTLLTVEKAG